MTKIIQPEGTCSFCGETMTKRKLANHLEKCISRQEANAAAEKTAATDQKLFHLRVVTPYKSLYWLDLEINSSARLSDLDEYLREIWLECCGHMSEFTAGKRWGERLSENRKMMGIFVREPAIYYAYDFGSTTELVIEKIGARQGKPVSENPITLLSRNVIPKEKCGECDQDAEYLCNECLYENGSVGFFCEEHADEHEHEEYLLPYVNSPRIGVCGYEGPAEPPY